MKFTEYLKDRLWAFGIQAFALLVIVGMLALFFAPSELIAAVCAVFFLTEFAVVLTDYRRKCRFFQELTGNLALLDQKYLVLEMLSRPSFYEGEIICQALYEIDKSMTENVKKYRNSVEDFKDYIEMWVHEVKLPIASLQLMCHNSPDMPDVRRFQAQLRRLDACTDQALYYVRAENANRDYLIRQTDLSGIVRHAAVRNKDDLLLSGIDFTADVPEGTLVTTDAKWVEFMLGQLLSNSIKYRRQGVRGQIRITAERDEDAVVLAVWDNGIGIPEADIPRLFDKSFTGENGRLHAKSTGMGLYIVKQLCGRLGHEIAVRSRRGSYTCVEIRFTENDFLRVAQHL